MYPPRLIPVIKSLTLIAGLVSGPTTLAEQPINRPLPAGAIVQMRHEGQITAVTFSPDGKLLASASTSGTIRLWNPETGKLILELTGHKDGSYGLSFSPDGMTLASAGGDSLLRLWDVVTGKELRAYRGHTDKAITVAFAPDGKTLASGSYDGSIRIWDVATGTELRRLLGHEERVTSVAFHPDGRTLASGGTATTDPQLPGGGRSAVAEAGWVRLWDVATGEEVRRLDGRGTTVAFSSDGSTLAAGGLHLVLGEKEYGSSSIRIIEGHKVLDIRTFNVIRLWDIVSGKALVRFQGRGGAVALSPDGQTVASGAGTEEPHYGGNPIANLLGAMDQSKKLRLWNAVTQTRLFRFPEEHTRVLTFSPSGTTLVSGTQKGEIFCWDVSNRAREAFSKAHDLPALEPEKLWTDLAKSEGVAADACDTLFRAGDNGVAYVCERLRPIPVGEPKRIRQLIDNLGSGQFQTREAATRELTQLGPEAKLYLERALEDQISPEVRRRIKDLLAVRPVARNSPDVLRAIRVIGVVEQLDTIKAREYLEALASGAPTAYQTQAAKAALARLKNSNSK